jgi:hypothetical protein
MVRDFTRSGSQMGAGADHQLRGEQQQRGKPKMVVGPRAAAAACRARTEDEQQRPDRPAAELAISSDTETRRRAVLGDVRQDRGKAAAGVSSASCI